MTRAGTASSRATTRSWPATRSSTPRSPASRRALAHRRPDGAGGRWGCDNEVASLRLARDQCWCFLRAMSRLREETPRLVAVLDPLADPDDIQASSVAAFTLLVEILPLVAERRARPGSGMISALLASPSDERGLTADEAVMMMLLLLAAGHETTAGLIGNAVVALHDHPLAARSRCGQVTPGHPLARPRRRAAAPGRGGTPTARERPGVRRHPGARQVGHRRGGSGHGGPQRGRLRPGQLGVVRIRSHLPGGAAAACVALLDAGSASTASSRRTELHKLSRGNAATARWPARSRVAACRSTPARPAHRPAHPRG